jgi:hypothetical protein
MATGISSYSDILKKNLIVSGEGTPNKDFNEEKDLVDKIRKLKQAIPIGYDDLKNKVDDIAQKAESVRVKNDQDLRKKQKEINELMIRVSNLERQVEKLQRNVDTIDAGEAMKIIEIHIASFVLPRGEEIARIGAFDQILECPQGDTWFRLRKQCDVNWTKEHLKTKEKFITYRNIDAHHKKFDLAQLKTAMIKRMPHRAQHCKDFVNLFEKVNSLMKFGILASEFVERDVNKKKFSKAHIDMVNRIARTCCRDVEYLQDIDMKTAKKHLVQYFPELGISHLDSLISAIKNTNCPRLGKLVEQKELEIVSKILQNPAILTFNQMDIFLARGESSSRKQAERWNELTDGKGWNKYHNEAMIKLKMLLPDVQNERVDPLPLNIAQLHIADFLGKWLWDAGSDILEIFVRWRFKT